MRTVSGIHDYGLRLFLWIRSMAVIPNDGKQTPMCGHPVFIAQHAIVCCCRGCLYKWHGIPAGMELTAEEQKYVVDVRMKWIEKQVS